MYGAGKIKKAEGKIISAGPFRLALGPLVAFQAQAIGLDPHGPHQAGPVLLGLAEQQARLRTRPR